VPQSISHDALTFDVDDLGQLANVTVDTSVYSQTAIFKTAYWYTEHCYIFLSRLDSQRIVVELRPKKDPQREALDALCREFCNAIIDYQVRQAVIAETGGIRDVLVKKAFGEGAKHLDPDALVSGESALPEPDDNYREDPLKIGRLTGDS